jgi:FMN phosphatase YigB (HAD superfamily)
MYHSLKKLISPIVIFDLDGVLADNSTRRNLLDSPNPDWEEYFQAASFDLPIDPNIDLAGSFKETASVVILTGRPNRISNITQDWLNRYQVNWDLLIMRPDSGYISAPDFKKQETLRLLDIGFQIVLALDDELENIQIYKELNIPTVHITPPHFSILP